MSDISDKWELTAARVAPQTRTTPVARRPRAQSTGTCIPAHVLVVVLFVLIRTAAVHALALFVRHPRSVDGLLCGIVVGLADVVLEELGLCGCRRTDAAICQR